MAQSFARQLKQWRGSRPQKQAADILQVPLKTYQNWEQSENEPNALSLEELRRRMAEHPE